MLGTHNSCTYTSLLGWQKILTPLAWLFARCQSKTLEEQFKAGARVFDIQISQKNKFGWYISHGGIWYDMSIIDVLKILNNLAYIYKEPIYIRLGLDNHWMQKSDNASFMNLIKYIQNNYSFIEICEIYIEKPWKIIRECSIPTVHKYWTLSWAKSKCNKWWKLFYYLPIPYIWSKIYRKYWLKDNPNNYLIIDFI